MVFYVGSQENQENNGSERFFASDGLCSTGFVRDFESFDQNEDGSCRLRVDDGKRIKLMDSNQQVVMPLSMSEEPSPLGLKLRKSPSFLDLIELKLSQGRKRAPPVETMHHIGFERKKAMNDDFASQPSAEKLKASNLYALLLRIGSWERISKNKGDLVAKCYYAKRKLVWEVLDFGLKSKIEIHWSDISAIRAIFHENEPGILEIELQRPPLFFQETNPQPRKHTLWQATTDFTGGRAPIYRRHFVQFPEGTLEKHYEKLLQCDSRLYMLSQRPFPSAMEPYFCLNHVQYSNYYPEPNVIQPEFTPTLHPSYTGTFPSQYVGHLGDPMSTVVPPRLIMKSTHLLPNIGPNDSTSPNSVMDFPHIGHQMTPFSDERLENEKSFGERNGDQIEELPMIDFDSSNQIGTFLPRQISSDVLFSMDGMGRPSSDNWGLNAITEHVLYDSQAFACSNAQNVAAQVNYVYPQLAPSQLGTPQPDSKYGCIGLNCEEHVIENGTNDSVMPMSSEQMNGDPSSQFDVQESYEPWLTKLPRVASYPNFYRDQTVENFADEEPNEVEWNHLL